MQSVTSTLSFTTLIAEQRAYFQSGVTLALAFRLAQLRRLKALILEHRGEIELALKTDLNKPQLEAYIGEIRPVLQEIDHALKHLKQWLKPQTVGTDLALFPAQAQRYAEPLGVVLIISPWNYPFALVLTPLIGAIAAGNCVIIKPSEMSEATSALLTHLINENFSSQHIRVIPGAEETSQALLAQKFDHIFFTGSTRVGKIVMEAAAKQLIPVTLELGGKSPCIVEPDINIQETAKRIIWGKFLNAGQTCIAPDYLLVHQAIQEPLLAALTTCIREFYGQDPAQSPDYCRLINAQHLERLRQFLADGDILCGGEWDAQSRYLAPTLLINVDPTAPIMQSEIFGPILPIFDYDILDSAIAFINERPKPLALYLFSQNQYQQEKVLTRTSSGGICFNDTLLQFSAISLPFGGIGSSGMGSYHGKASFDTFSHHKSVLKRGLWLEFNLRFPPYLHKLKWIQRLLG